MSTLTIYPTGDFETDSVIISSSLEQAYNEGYDTILLKATDISGSFCEWNLSGSAYENPDLYPNWYVDFDSELYPGVKIIDWQNIPISQMQKTTMCIQHPIRILGENFEEDKTTVNGGRFMTYRNPWKDTGFEMNFIRIGVDGEGKKYVIDDGCFNVDGDVTIENIHFKNMYNYSFVMANVHTVTYKDLKIEKIISESWDSETFPGDILGEIPLYNVGNLENMWQSDPFEHLQIQMTLDPDNVDFDPETGLSKPFGIGITRRIDQVNVSNCEYIGKDNDYTFTFLMHCLHASNGILIEDNVLRNMSIGFELEPGYLYEEYEGNGRVALESAKEKKKIARRNTIISKKKGYSTICSMNALVPGVKMLPSLVEENVIFWSQNPDWSGWAGSPIDMNGGGVDEFIVRKNKIYFGSSEIEGGYDLLSGLLSLWSGTCGDAKDYINEQLSEIDGKIKEIPDYCYVTKNIVFEKNICSGNAMYLVVDFFGDVQGLQDSYFINNNEVNFIPTLQIDEGGNSYYFDYSLGVTSTNNTIVCIPSHNSIGDIEFHDEGVNNKIITSFVGRRKSNVFQKATVKRFPFLRKKMFGKNNKFIVVDD